MLSKPKMLIIFVAVAIAWGAPFYIVSHSEQKLIRKLKKYGVTKMGYVISVRRYFPPKGKNGYGEISYEYQNIKGNVLKGKGLVSQLIYDQYHPGDKIDVVYDPDHTTKSRIAIILNKSQ